MDIIRLESGSLAPDDADCIKINPAVGGGFSLVAAAMALCGDGEEAESVALVSSEPYMTFEAAEAAGLAWAETHCVQQIYVETGGGAEPVMPVDK